MQKRKLYWAFVLTALFLACGLTALGAAVKHEPSFYRNSQVPPSDARKELASTFFRNFSQMLADIKGKQLAWGCDATEVQMNSFFEEIFDQMGETEGLRKLGISAANVVLEEERVRLAFRYGTGAFSTIISYDLKIWLVPKEPNVIAVEILRARAGALPISSRTILQQLSDYATKQNYKVTLYRHEGHSVALIDLQGDQQATGVMTLMKTGTNSLSIRGRTLENVLPPLVLHNNAKKSP